MTELSDAYRIDRLTAEFIFPETERQFRHFIRASWVDNTRQTIFLAALFYLMFSVTDFLLMGAGREYLLVLLNRLVVCGIGLTAAFLAARLWQHLVNGLIPSLVVSIALLAYIGKTMLVPLDHGVHGMGMMLMLLGVYTFIPNRFIAALSVCAPASVIFLMVMLAHFGLSFGQMAAMTAMLLVINVLGAMVAWRSSMTMREAYFDHAVLKSANERLEREIEARQRLEEVLRQRADHDETTGLANRTTFFETAQRLLREAEETRRPLSLLLLDVDYFKQLNGTYGHMRGDEVLKALASVCIAVLEPGHFLARLGGEEFVVLLPDTTQAAAAVVAGRIRAECQRMPVAIAEVSINFTVSVGVAQLRPGDSINVLLRRADEAMSSAKYKGRNRVEVAA